MPGRRAPTTVTYGYDGDGVLRDIDGPESRHYLWDIAAPAPLLALERDASGTTRRTYTHGHDLITSTISDRRYAVHQDQIGSVTSLTGPQGTVEARYSYSPFGALERRFGGAADNRPTLGFAGMPHDLLTGFVHMHARTYDPTTGQFLQRDPVAAPPASPAASPYAYALGRPNVLADPTGQCPWCVLAGVGAVVGGAIGGAAYALTTDDFDVWQFGGAVAGGAVAGAVTGVSGPLGGSIATGVFGTSSATGGAAIATTAVINGLGGAAATTVEKRLGYGRAPTAVELALGAATNAYGGWFGNKMFPMHGVYTIAQAPHFAPRSWASLLSGSRNITALYLSAVAGATRSTLWSAYGSFLFAPTRLSDK